MRYTTLLIISLVFALLFSAASAAETQAGSTDGSGSESVTTWIETGFARNFGVHEPIYFIYGGKDPAAKFQISFKYRLFGDPEDSTPRHTTRGVFFGYTQCSVWDIDSISGPFHDTSYMPELFFQSAKRAPDTDDFQLAWLGWQGGVLHESNGKDDPGSRSIDILFFRPAVLLGHPNGWRFIFSPRVFVYICDLRENPDIKEYRGYAEWHFIVGRKRGFELSTNARIGTTGRRGSVQFDLTYPVRIPRIDFAAYLHLQYFNGYGETILDYMKRDSQLRAGFSVAR